MKKYLALILAVLMLTALFAGCQAAPQQPAEEEQQGEAAGTEGEADGMVFGLVAQFMSHEFYKRCNQGVQDYCDQNNIELLIGDGNGDANEQLNIAQQFITKGVDCILLSPSDPTACKAIVDAADKAGIPVVTESDRVEGALTKVGLDTYEAGQGIGEWVGNELNSKGIEGKILIVNFPQLQNIVDLVDGYLAGLDSTGCKYEVVSDVDGAAMKETAMQVSTDALTANPDINVIFGINDDSVLGAIQAAKTLNFDLTNVITCTNGLEGNPGCIAMMEEGTLTVAMAQLSECYGMVWAEAGYKAAMGETLPSDYFAPSCIITKDNFTTYYNGGDGDYTLNYDAAWALRDEMNAAG